MEGRRLTTDKSAISCANLMINSAVRVQTAVCIGPGRIATIFEDYTRGHVTLHVDYYHPVVMRCYYADRYSGSVPVTF